jgi:hypothetical protein
MYLICVVYNGTYVFKILEKTRQRFRLLREYCNK